MKSPYSLHFGLNLSYMERLMRLPLYQKVGANYEKVCTLIFNENWREIKLTSKRKYFYPSKECQRRVRPLLRDKIAAQLSKSSSDSRRGLSTFFDAELVSGITPTCTEKFKTILPNSDIPIVFKNVANGKEERIQGSFSWFNPIELIQGNVPIS